MAAGAVLAGDGGGAAALPATMTQRARRLGFVDLAAAVIVLLGVVGTAVVAARTGFTGADLGAQTRAAGQGLWQALGDRASGPGSALGRTVTWALARAAPLDRTAALTVAVAVRGLLAVASWALLRTVVGPRLRALPLLAVAVAGPALLVVTVDTLTAVPVLLAATGVLAALVVHLQPAGRIPGRLRLALLALAVAVAVAADLSAVVTPVVLAAAAAASASGVPEGRHGSPRRTIDAGIGVASGAALLVAAVALAAGVTARGLGTIDPAVLGTGLRRAVEGVVGAPWRWAAAVPLPVPQGPAPIVVWVVAGALAVLVLVAARRAPVRALAAAGVVVAWVAAAALTAGRGDRAAWSLAATATVAGVAGLALLASSWPAPLTRRLAARRRRAAPRGARLLRAAPGGVILLGTAALLALDAVGAVSFARAAAADPVQAWLGTVRASLEALPPFPRIVPRALPAVVAADDGAPDLDAPVVAALRPDALLHDADGPMLALDDAGRLGAASPARLAAGARAPLCAAVLRPGERGPAVVRLTTPTPLGPGALVRVGVLVKDTTDLDVHVEDGLGVRYPVRRWNAAALYPGPHTVVYPATGAEAVAVTVATTASEAGLCVVSAEIVRQP